jgi:hypothetical protein
MQDAGYGLPRIRVPRTLVNKGENKGRGCLEKNPDHHLSSRCGYTRLSEGVYTPA